jgi:hypothetical protein
LCGLQLFVTVPLEVGLGWATDHCPKPLVLMGVSRAGTASFARLASPYHGHGLLRAFVVLLAICDASAHARGGGRRVWRAPDVQLAPGLSL